MPVVPELHSIVHREAGPVATFLTRDEAEEELKAIVLDEPDWAPDLWIELFNLIVIGRRIS